ncbi:MAG: phosphoribosylformylglycinamidine cyclo-ligase [Proteobacteria bacterium]|nr:phosphoribosylformylglycinamidine cyclo-ligase [Pseudomonadota bacterium]
MGDAAYSRRVSHDRYKEAGVDIDAGNSLIKRIGPFAAATSRPEVLGGLGGFGSMWKIPAGRFEDLVLVSGTDGVGTKLKIAQAAGVHDTIGIDLVAMCVNDVVCAGAEPFFFLDYYACGRLDVDVAADVVKGIADGCTQAGCSLVGGETAEMPGVYADDVYDLAGFCVGGVERADILDGSQVRRGMKLLGLASTGIHSNGFSLVRKVVLEEHGLSMSDPMPGCDGTVAETLLTPTRIYVLPVLRALREFDVGAVCHITGGGLVENLPRVLPKGAVARIERGSWDIPPVFRSIQELGGITDGEMVRTFNHGVGMVMAVDAEQASDVLELMGAMGAPGTVIGEIVADDGDPRTEFV